MLILAVDTATTVASTALLRGDELIAEEYMNIPQKKHSERLMPLIDAMLKGAGYELGRIEGFAVSAGPGSFTGLRIGMGTLKGFAHVLDRPLVAVSTLEALASNFYYPGAIICPLLDAKQGYLYLSLYLGTETGLKQLYGHMAVRPEEVCGILREQKGDIVLLGDGVDICRELLLNGGIKYLEPPKSLRMPRASGTAYLGSKLLAAGKGFDYFALEPFYVRKSAAEINLRNKKESERRNSSRC